MNFGEWVNNKLSERMEFAKTLAENLQKMMDAEEEQKELLSDDPAIEPIEDFSIVNKEGNIEKISLRWKKNWHCSQMTRI